LFILSCRDESQKSPNGNSVKKEKPLLLNEGLSDIPEKMTQTISRMRNLLSKNKKCQLAIYPLYITTRKKPYRLFPVTFPEVYCAYDKKIRDTLGERWYLVDCTGFLNVEMVIYLN